MEFCWMRLTDRSDFHDDLEYIHEPLVFRSQMLT